MAQWLSILAALEGDWDLIFQHSHGGSESVTPVPETPDNLSGFPGHQAFMQCTYIHAG